MTIKNERRENPRIGISFPVACKTLPSRRYFYTVSKDLSLMGVRILSNDFLPKNDFIKLNINLINKILNLKARIIWCSRERVSDRYLAGLEFVEIGDLDRQNLSEFINVIYNKA